MTDSFDQSDLKTYKQRFMKTYKLDSTMDMNVSLILDHYNLYLHKNAERKNNGGRK